MVKWSTNDLSQAMTNAIAKSADVRFLKHSGNTIKFNGFWRDGNKQNVCMWLDRATWHDAKTGEGGGCKEFAKISFGMTLYEFMDRFGQASLIPIKTPLQTTKKYIASKSVHKIWSQLCEDETNNSKLVEEWLEKVRGFNSPKANIGSGFCELTENNIIFFDTQDYNFLRHRLSLGPQLVAPIRSSDSNEVENLFFRSISTVDKNDKARLLPNQGGWSSQNGYPRAFGFPHLINDFPKLILCEGMADYFAVECLLACNENYLAIGAAHANALELWANWISTNKYSGHVIILYQLDVDQYSKVSAFGIGQTKASKALKILLQNKISASLFPWANFLRCIKAHEHKPKDIADISKIYGTEIISYQFIKTLNKGS